MSLPLLKATIDSFVPGRMTEDDANGLELLLTLPAFEPLWSLVEDKLEAFYDHLHAHPAFDFVGNTATEKPLPVPPKRKPKKKMEAATKAAPKPTTMKFKVINGILIPISS